MQEYKKIPVTPEVYLKVGEIAAANRRKLGAQVAWWVEQTCQHPIKARQNFDLWISYPDKIDTVPAHGFKCRACGRLVVQDGRQEEEE